MDGWMDGFIVCRSDLSFVIPVAGRGGRAGIQDDVLAVPRRGRQSELRVHRARRRGTWLAAGWPGTVLRSSRRTHATSLKGGRTQSLIMPPCPCDVMGDPLPIYPRAARETLADR
jgi:hypothetical protein